MKNGINQSERMSSYLDPYYVVPDERSIMELVQFTLDYSKSVSYHDFLNRPIGNWRSFLLNDPVFIAGLISATILDPYKSRQDDLSLKSQNSGRKKAAAREGMAENLLSMLKHLFYWERLMLESNYSGPLAKEIFNSRLYIEPLVKRVIPLQSKFKSEDFSGLVIPESMVTQELDFNGVFKDSYKNLVFIVELAHRHFAEMINRSSGKHQPHVGLLLAALRLFAEVQTDLNTLTLRHLDYYYQRILQQTPPTPKEMGLLVALLPKPGKDTLDRNTSFSWIFPSKKSVQFRNQFLAELSQAKIEEVRTMYKSSYSPFSKDTHDGQVALSEVFDKILYRGEGKSDISFRGDFGQKYPLTMGEDQSQKGIHQRSMNPSLIGLVVSSPVFLVEVGKHQFEINFYLSKESCEEFQRMLSDLLHEKEAVTGLSHDHSEHELDGFVQAFLDETFIVSVTGANGWKPLDYVQLAFFHQESRLSIKLEPEGIKELPVPFDQAIHGALAADNWPCVRLMVNNSAHYPPYRIIQVLEILEIDILTNSHEVSSGAEISNQIGKLDPETPFLPFGPLPKKDSYFRVYNPLIFNKYLSQMSFTLSWLGLPEERNGFNSLYRAYKDVIVNESFQGHISLRPLNANSNASYDLPEQNFTLFETVEKPDGRYLKKNRKIGLKLDLLDLTTLAAPTSKTIPSEEKNALTIRLVEPNPFAFGHEAYPPLFAEISLHNSKHPRKVRELPNTPYTPLLEKISFSYCNYAKENLDRKGSMTGESIKIYHILPFGNAQIYPTANKEPVFLLPQLDGRGSLLLGLTGVQEGEVLNIGFKLHPAFFIHTITRAPRISWEYMENDTWISMDDLLMEDSTQGMLQSGIVKLRLPSRLDFNSSRMPSDKFWIRVSNLGSLDINSSLISLFVNAAWLTQDMAELSDVLSPEELKEPAVVLSKGTLSLNGVSGPYHIKVSSARKTPEQDRVRVSEMLRHRNRGITTWDLERLVLENFPQIGRVLVYGRSDFPLHLVKNSNVQVVVIPHTPINEQYTHEGYRAPFELLNEIKEYLKSFLSPFARLEVGNPVFEKLKIRASVKFKSPQQSGYYRDVLERELVEFLSPNPGKFRKDGGFINSIYKVEIQNFMESRPYVEMVTGLSVLQLVEALGSYKIIDTADSEYRIEQLRTISPYAILTSSDSHQLDIIYEQGLLEPEIASIGDLSIDSDFIIKQIK